jgi:hypothetical protein
MYRATKAPVLGIRAWPVDDVGEGEDVGVGEGAGDGAAEPDL